MEIRSVEYLSCHGSHYATNPTRSGGIFTWVYYRAFILLHQIFRSSITVVSEKRIREYNSMDPCPAEINCPGSSM